MDQDKIIEMMQSDDYRERFKAEYYQLKDRHQKLHLMLAKHRLSKLDFTPKCSITLLEEQERYMELYLFCLEERAEIEGIDIR